MSVIHYSHEDEVRFNEGCLGRSADWQWFVELTESQPKPDLQLFRMSDFRSVFSRVSDVYSHLCHLCMLGLDEALSFSSLWLQDILQASRIWHGDIDLTKSMSQDVFFDVLNIVAYATHLLNELTDDTYVYRTDFYTLRNLSEIYRFDALGERGSVLLRAFDGLELEGANAAREIVNDNLSGFVVPCDQKLVGNFLDGFFGADFFSFSDPDRSQCATWEELYLFEMPMTEIIDGRLVPAISMGGSSHPDFSRWNPKTLRIMREKLADHRAVCMIESVDYLLNGVEPSGTTIRLIGNLAAERITDVVTGSMDMMNLHCTAVELAALFHARIDRKNPDMVKLMADVCRAYGPANDATVLVLLGQMGFPLNAAQRATVDAEDAACIDRLPEVSDPYELKSYFEDERVRRHCNQKLAEEAMELLATMVSTGTADRTSLAELFHGALSFLIALLDNPSVSNDWAKLKMIELKDNWTNVYYHIMISHMQTIETSGKIASDSIAQYNDLMIRNPAYAAALMMPMNDNHLSEMLVAIGNSPLMVNIGSIEVDEFFPRIPAVVHDDTRAIDQLIFDTLDKVNRKYAYRQLNHFETEDVLLRAYEQMRHAIEFTLALVAEPSRLYESIVEKAPQHYQLLEYPSGTLSIGHLTQLFPLLENTIRDIGAQYLVVPFQLRDRMHHVSKDVVSVLGEVLGQAYEVTGTLEGVNDLLLVYHVMYSSNGFNIRNACIHGRDYQCGERLEFAFRATLFCTHAMLWRLGYLRGDEGKQ